MSVELSVPGEIDQFEAETPRVIRQLVNDLSSDKDWIRIKAQEMILSRTCPTRDIRSIKFDIDRLDSLSDLARAARNIFFIATQGIINAKEAQSLMSLLQSLKEIIIDAEFGYLFEDMKSFVEHNPEWQAYLKNRSK